MLTMVSRPGREGDKWNRRSKLDSFYYHRTPETFADLGEPWFIPT